MELFTENEESDQGRLMGSSSTLEEGSSGVGGVDLTLRISTTPSSMIADEAHIPASSLIIGAWVRMSKNEGDLTAKILYETKELVWEILEGALKIKIEMKWNDISAISAHTLEHGWGKLDIQLDEQPSFFREFNPQPRKPTTWEKTTDFTEGHALICRRQTVHFPPGTLDEHYKRLLQCDGRLFELSRKSFPGHENAFFTKNLPRLSDLPVPTGCLPELTHAHHNYPVPKFTPPPDHLTLKTGPQSNIMNPHSSMSSVTDPMLIGEGVNNQNFQVSKAGGNVDSSVNTSMYQNAPPDQGSNEGVDLNLSISTPVYPNVDLPEPTMEEDYLSGKAAGQNNDQQGN